MANVIRLKRKTTTGAPALGDLAVGEACVVIPDEVLYIKKDASTLVSWPANAGAGDMSSATYDPGNVNGDAFDMDNMVEGTNTKILTSAERTAIANIASDISTAISDLVAAAPGSLDTLNELAAALGDDANFSATMTSALAGKLDSNSEIDGGTIT